jgi:hypothetical protein
VSTLTDKYGGATILNSNNRSFRELLQQAALIDLGFSGLAFTSQPIFQRLDKAIVCTQWQEIYARAHVKHLSKIYSDHTPILLRIVPSERKNKVFRIEHWWMTLKGFDEECSRLWSLL